MGLDRVKNAFHRNRTAFMPYTVLGYPTQSMSLQVVKMLVDVGADLLELGVPFSDPLADGPTIQNATQKALENGITLDRCIRMVSDLRSDGVDIPALLMSYVNPILAYGVRKFVVDCASAGVDGFIVPDLPPEEAGGMEDACMDLGLALVYLIAPTTPPERLSLIVEKSRGFIYLVSLTGVTGTRDMLPAGLTSFVKRVRAMTDKPLAVGFGISKGEHATRVGQIADGVIVGSALVEQASKSVKHVYALAKELREALDSAAQI